MFFFFKQKTAYEMRISDWSSDVCSSDLWHCRTPTCRRWTTPARDAARIACLVAGDGSQSLRREISGDRQRHQHHRGVFRVRHHVEAQVPAHRQHGAVLAQHLAFDDVEAEPVRSEEHTSELQSLMRI